MNQKVGMWRLALVIGTMTCTVWAQQRGPSYPTGGPVVLGTPATPNTPDAQAQAAADAQTKADITDLANKIEAATVRGDVAYVDSVTSPDFTMVHGAGWTQGGKVSAADDKAAYLKRVKDKEYLVHDIDPSSIHFELHGDVAITYGRYISLYVPAGRNTANPPNLTSIWFERVYQKQNGKWMYLSHRSVRVANSPAGIDPGAVTSVTLNIQGNGFMQGATLQYEGNGTGTGLGLPGARRGAAGGAGTGAASRGTGASSAPAGPPATVSQVVYTGGANPDNNGGNGFGSVESPTNTSPEALELLALERKIGDAVPAGDADFWASVTSDDFQMTHGNIWTRGGIPTLVDNKQSFLQRVKSKQYNAFITDPATQKIEMHGNVAVTYGRYVASIKGFDPNIAWFSCWYERVFEKRDGKWVYLSHRTVHDPARGPTREAIGNK
jgi:hypothetical protein